MASGRKAGIGLLVTVVVLGGLLVLADRGAAWAAEDQISQRVAQQAAQKDISMSGEPEVTVRGFPFLTQVMGGEYQAVDITMREVEVDGIALSTLKVRATGVKADLSAVANGTGDVKATKVTGDASVGFRQIEELIGREGTKVSSKGGKLVIRTPVEVGPTKLNAVARASVKVAGGAINIDVEDVTFAEGDPPSAVRSQLARSLSRRIELPKLPYGLKLSGAAVTDTGVVANAAGADVSLVS